VKKRNAARGSSAATLSSIDAGAPVVSSSKKRAPIERASADETGVGGSIGRTFNWAIVRETAATIRMLGPEEDKTVDKLLEITCTALRAFNPLDEIEGMLAAQAIALHFGAMEALRRSMISDQPAEIAARLRKDGANLARAYTDMLDALDRKRGKAQQVVRVERVVVEDGGQAIVGNVNAEPKRT
jgi:hypothetical protein